MDHSNDVNVAIVYFEGGSQIMLELIFKSGSYMKTSNVSTGKITAIRKIKDGMWQLTGTPCSHTISFFYKKGHDHPDKVGDIWATETYDEELRDIIKVRSNLPEDDNMA